MADIPKPPKPRITDVRPNAADPNRVDFTVSWDTTDLTVDQDPIVREMLADAWDEGFARGEDYDDTVAWNRNPYRNKETSA